MHYNNTHHGYGKRLGAYTCVYIRRMEEESLYVNKLRRVQDRCFHCPKKGSQLLPGLLSQTFSVLLAYNFMERKCMHPRQLGAIF